MRKFILAAALMLALVLPVQALATNDDKITICHNTGSENNPTATITIDESAWEAHKEHGDTKGACPSASPSQTATPTQTPTATPTVTQGPIPPTRPPYTVAPSPTAIPTVKPSATPTEAPKATVAPTPAPVAPKQLPSTSTD